jgi:hypothetical protein
MRLRVHHPRTRRQRRERRVTKGLWFWKSSTPTMRSRFPSRAQAWRSAGRLAAGSRSGAAADRKSRRCAASADPDVIEPGEPNPARTPMRVRGAKRSPESFAASLSMFKAGTVTRAEQLILKYGVRTFMMEANLADPSTQTASPQVHP